MLEQLLNKIKTYVFGEIAHGERVQFPKINSMYPEGYSHQEKTTTESIKAYNEWCESINFGGMYVKEQY